ncbi:hypothetical protein V491_04066 [Pseudogymnoascus sp. VKM F-3775]|nr:hypothetical protein V491_04066 [Pseudogymnoascus sp. VKM F-3775]
MEKIREEKGIKSAFDSSTFDANVSIHVQKSATDIGSATISPSGRDVAIASKTGLDIIDLDSPLNPPRHLRHGTSWNIADVQWSPFAARDYWVACTANQKALVWNLAMQEDTRQGAIEHTLHAHTRAITDINFSAHHPDILATCAVDGYGDGTPEAVDGYVNAWDLRRPRRPALTFVDWDAGATQVKWNRQEGHILASSHDRWLRIWDDRHGAYPVKSIEAHSSKIYGVDWNRVSATQIITCSLDKSIKFWDTAAEEAIPERVIRTSFPVWRARHTPFGWGLLAMPQNAPGNLYLYDRRKEGVESDTMAPAAAVFNHGERQVKEFLWRSRGSINEEGMDNREFQLVSWGDDKELKLQRVANSVLENVGYIKGSQMTKKLNVTRKGAIYKTFRNVERAEMEKKSATIKAPRLLSSSHDKENSYSVLSDEIKKMSPTKRFRTRMGINGSTMRGKPINSERRSQINWMSGIKFSTNGNGNGDDEDGQGKIPVRRLSVISPNFDMEGDWDTPESLHDEIIRVHQQYSKVTFNDVNMDTRSVTASMNGPWGKDGGSVFIKATIQFPDQYPGATIPTFTIGKSSLISDETSERISQEVQQIASGFVGRHRGCLEAALCYLLGEVNLEESTQWLKGPDDVDNLDDGIADVSSSDEDDDDIPATNSAMMSQELDPTSAEGILVASRRHANVPPPRLSGARFSNNGRLVCFFPPKEERFKSLLGSVALDKSRVKDGPSFNTFSRLATESLPPRSKFASLNEEEDFESDSSQGSGSESSSDSDSSQFQVSVAFDFWRKIHGTSYRKGLSTNRSNKSSGAGTGTGTGTGTLSKGRLSKPKNTIAMYDVSDYLPGKLELAQEYAVFGEGTDVCNHNAMIAMKYGHQERADLWTYAGMLLHHEVPLEILDQSHRKEPILVIARDMIKHCRRDSQYDSGIDMPFDPKNSAISGRVKWGHSPLAKHLIDDLFDHFEKLVDIQMLAMLSCVFSEPSAIDQLPNAEVRLTQPQTPLSMKTPAFSLDYFPSDIAVWSAYQKTPYSSIPSTPRAALTPFYGSLGSSNGPWGSDPASASFSCGETPPLRSTGGSLERLNEKLRLQSQSLSTSPDDRRLLQRANSSLAASFASNLKNPFHNTGSSSPPNRKRPSPVESMINTLTPSAVTWGNTTYLESVREKSRYAKSSHSDDESSTVNETLVPVTGISVTMHNQSAFDDEGCMSTPLLGFEHTAVFKNYRMLYAEMLFAWSLPFTRLEILKFDSLPDYYTAGPPSPSFSKPHAASIHSVEHDMPPSPILLGKQDSHQPVSDRGLSITAYCLKHEHRLEPLTSSSISSLGGAVGRCERCKMTKRQLKCVICIEPITGDYAACLSCGCASHQICLEAYLSSWDDDEATKDDMTCAGGCDCDCTRRAGMGVVESWEVMMGALEKMRKKEAKRAKGREVKVPPRRLTEEWDEGSDWEGARESKTEVPPAKTPVRGPMGQAMGQAQLNYSTLSRRLGQVRAGDGWMGVGSGLRKKGSVSSTERGG